MGKHSFDCNIKAPHKSIYMKTKLISIGLILLIFSCSPTRQEDTSSDDTAEKTEVDTERSVVYDPSGAIWNYDFNQQTEKFEITQLRPVDSDTLTGESLEKIINKFYPKVQIKFVGTSDDTAFISIPDSEVLTQQMGTAGAESFMVTTTFSFTELKGIKYVSFDFKEGDHAIPGVYNRNSWDGVKIQ
jgi:hypothetical protein